jgi:3-methyladenine DNA glycosylase/8-oxoguanine DNA glycosylase
VTAPPQRRRYRPPFPLDLRLTLAPLAGDLPDPGARWDRQGALWWCTRTEEGPGTLRFLPHDGEVELAAYGPGAALLLDRAPQLLGEADRPEELRVTGKLRELQRRFPGLRLSRGSSVYEAAVRTVLGQLVNGKDALRSQRELSRRFGEVAPGPWQEERALPPLLLLPAPVRLAALPYYELHPLGVERRRAQTLREVARAAQARRGLDQPGLPLAEVQARLARVRGIGPWSIAEVSRLALGDPDAVPVGDFHLKNVVTFAFTGEPRGTDERMLELLAPFAGQRGRVLRLIAAAGIEAPRFGPRLPRRDFRTY